MVMENAGNGCACEGSMGAKDWRGLFLMDSMDDQKEDGRKSQKELEGIQENGTY
jgi:hypothetical protein